MKKLGSVHHLNTKPVRICTSTKQYKRPLVKVSNLTSQSIWKRPFSSSNEVDKKLTSADQTNKRQRGLFSLKNFEEEERIFDETPIAVVPVSNEYCSNCLNDISSTAFLLPSGEKIRLRKHTKLPEWTNKLKRVRDTTVGCHICRIERFCSPTCESEGFQSFHQHLCPVSKYQNSAVLLELNKLCKETHTNTPIMVARLFAKVLSESGTNPTSLQGDTWEFLQQLERIDVSRLQNVPTIEKEFTLLKRVFPTDLFTRQLFEDLRATCMVNHAELLVETMFIETPTSEGYDASTSPSMTASVFAQPFGRQERPKEFMTIPEHIGYGDIFPRVGVFMNHSCVPNVEIQASHNAKKLEWVALRPIEAGEELMIAYVSPLLTAYERRNILLHYYGFVCECEACLEEIQQNPFPEEMMPVS